MNIYYRSDTNIVLGPLKNRDDVVQDTGTCTAQIRDEATEELVGEDVTMIFDSGFNDWLGVFDDNDVAELVVGKTYLVEVTFVGSGDHQGNNDFRRERADCIVRGSGP